MKKMRVKIVLLLLTICLAVPSSFLNLTVATAKENDIDNTSVLETRFLNMLNHSYVYGSDFDCIETIVNNSVIALLGFRDSENFDYIAEEVVNKYLYDMYGLEIDDFSNINTDFPRLDGLIYILPRGYAKYNHKALSLTLNQDGTYMFETAVTIKTHDGVEENATCKTRFVKNSTSSFGFNIVTSEID